MKNEHKTENPDFSKLEAFQSIDMENDWNLVSQRMGIENSRGPSKRDLSKRDLSKSDHKIQALKKSYLAMAWKVAATLLVILGIGYLSQRYVFSPREMISVRAGDELVLLTLEDGSRVSLNSNSEIFYPEKFRSGKREVLLKGEAFFEVEKNPNKPFLINIEEKAMVEVLGTSFNIRSERSGEAISVLVVEGRVALSEADGETDGDAGSKIPGLILEKGEQARMTGGTIFRKEAIDKNMLSWKTGILYFDQSYIGDVVNQLESHYKKQILLNKNVPGDLQFTSTIDNQELKSVLEELSMVLGLKISYDIDEDHINNYINDDNNSGNKSGNEKILISKLQ